MQKPRTPIKRYTPLKRTGLKRRKGNMPFVTIRRVSSKRQIQLEAYWPARLEFLKAHPFCQLQIREACANELEVIAMGGMLPNGIKCTRSRDIHHMHGRVGAMLTDRNHWLAVCRRSHEMIHQNPAWARSRGYLQ